MATPLAAASPDTGTISFEKSGAAGNVADNATIVTPRAISFSPVGGPAATPSPPAWAGPVAQPAAPAPAPEPPFASPVGPPVGGGAPGAASGVRPLSLFALSLVLLAGAGLVLYVAIDALIRSVPDIGGDGSREYRAFQIAIVVYQAIYAIFGLALLAALVLTWRQRRLGRALVWTAGIAIVAAQAISTGRDGVGTWTMVVAIAAVLLAAMPDLARYLATDTARPTAVVAFVSLGAPLAGLLAVTGASFLPLGEFYFSDSSTELRVCGGITLAAAVVFLVVLRSVGAGAMWARVVASAALIAAGVALEIVGERDSIFVLLAAAAGLLFVALWVGDGTAAHFATGAAAAGGSAEPAEPVRTWTAPSMAGAAASAAVVALVLAFGFTTPGPSEPDYVADGSTYQSAEPVIPNDTDYATPTDEPSYSDAGGSYTTTFNFDLTAEYGDATAQLEVGDPVPYDEAPSNGDASIGACSVDTSSTLAVPYLLTMTNTADVDQHVAMEFSGIGDGSIGQASTSLLLQEASYTDGESCNGQDDGKTSFTVYSSNELSSGSSSTSYGYFLITDYNDSSQAETPESLMSYAKLTVPDSFSVSNLGSTFTVTNASGSGMESDVSSWEFPLGG